MLIIIYCLVLLHTSFVVFFLSFCPFSAYALFYLAKHSHSVVSVVLVDVCSTIRICRCMGMKRAISCVCLLCCKLFFRRKTSGPYFLCEQKKNSPLRMWNRRSELENRSFLNRPSLTGQSIFMLSIRTVAVFFYLKHGARIHYFYEWCQNIK